MKCVARYLAAGLLVGLGAAACGSAPGGEAAGALSSEFANAVAACTPPSVPNGTVTGTCSATVSSGIWATPAQYAASCRSETQYPNTYYFAKCNYGCKCGGTVTATVPACPGGGSLGENPAGPCSLPV